MTRSLLDLGKRHPRTDKLGRLPPPRHHQYHEFYESAFAPYREKPIRILEIGVSEGDSLRAWKDYFPNAELILGIDVKIHDSALGIGHNVALLPRDAYTAETVSELSQLYPEKFDIIIDDGSHRLADQHFVLEHYLKLLSPKGILVVEDVPSANDPFLSAAMRRHVRRHQTGRDDECIVYVTGDDRGKTDRGSRLMATINIGRPEYGQYTLPTLREYAHRMGADFLELGHFPKAPQYGRGRYQGHPWFLQVDFLKTFAQQSYYTSLMLIDLDVMIRPDCEDLFDLVGDRLGMSIDMGMPRVDPQFGLWNQYCKDLFGRDPAIGSPYYNAGLIVGSLGAIREAAALMQPPYGDSSQNALNICLRDFTNWAVIPERFNWMAPQFAEASRRQQIVHFGGHKDLIPGFSFDGAGG